MLQVRWHVLASGKTLLSPQPRLRTGFFSTLSRDSIPAEVIMEAFVIINCLLPAPLNSLQVRWHVLASGKTLLSPQPRLRTGFFSTLSRNSIPAEAIMEACTSGEGQGEVW